MKQLMYSVSEVSKMILDGKKLILAASESALSQLPAGHWIGGTIPYFMTENGGRQSADEIALNELPGYVHHLEFRTYNTDHIHNIYKDAPRNGFTLIIIPASSNVLMEFALRAHTFEGFASSPLVGWVSGVHLSEIATAKPKVFLGEKLLSYTDRAIAMHVTLPENMYADINIINIFEQGDGDLIQFAKDGFSAETAIVNGKEVSFAEYIEKNAIDTKLPLVASYSGAMINTSFQSVDKQTGLVSLYAPVFKGIDYRIAKPVGDYVSEFTGHLPKDGIDEIYFSCNCILNYLYSELEGKLTGGIVGPVTFGEVAYQLLNQTLVYVSIHTQK